MKFRVLLISIAVLLALLAIGFGFIWKTDSDSRKLVFSDWESYSDEQLDKTLESVFSASRLPEGRETALLSWLFANHPERAERLIRERENDISGLPRHLSDTALALFRAGGQQSAVEIMRLARDLYPNDPDVLGIMGIIAYLGGSREEARRYLEQAESWGQNRPLVDFYLGGILVLSDSTADQTRGKTLLMERVRGIDEELKELSGLTLLTSTKVPLIGEDIIFVYTNLDEAGVFRPDNENLNADALRIITNKLVSVLPEEALETAELLLQYPGADFTDELGMIQLAQSQGNPGRAAPYIEALEERPDRLDSPEAARRFARLRMVQLFLEESHEAGLVQLEEIIENPEMDTVALQESFQSVLQSDLPMDVERQVLQAYLEMPSLSVNNSLQVLARLTSLSPLREKEYVAWAMENLFERNPLAVGSWLSGIEATGVLIEALEDLPALTPDQAVLLINTYLQEEEPELAQSVLDASRSAERAGSAAEMDPAVRAFLQSNILIQQGERERAAEFWEESHQAVMGSNRFPLLKNLGFLALEMDQPVNALQSLHTALAAGIPFTPEQAGQLLQLTLEYGNLQQSIEVAEYIARLQPDAPAAKNNLAYFQFLAESSVEESVEVMRELVEEYPDIHQFTLTLALGLIKSGRTNEANRLIQGTNIDWNDTSNRGRLIYAVVLAATDQRVVADGLIQSLDMEEFIPEERALLEAF
ncbi:MAG: hypothetical protein R6V45_06405 [Oceanipulchritudo sp.]